MSPVDLAANRGTVYYRESLDRGLLQMALKDVRSAFPGLKNVNLDWIFIVTWVDMAFYEPSYYYNPENYCNCASRYANYT